MSFEGTEECEQVVQGPVGCKPLAPTPAAKSESVCRRPWGRVTLPPRGPRRRSHFSCLSTRTAEKNVWTIGMDSYKVTPHDRCNNTDVLKHVFATQDVQLGEASPTCSPFQ